MLKYHSYPDFYWNLNLNLKFSNATPSSFAFFKYWLCKQFEPAHIKCVKHEIF